MKYKTEYVLCFQWLTASLKLAKNLLPLQLAFLPSSGGNKEINMQEALIANILGLRAQGNYGARLPGAPATARTPGSPNPFAATLSQTILLGNTGASPADIASKTSINLNSILDSISISTDLNERRSLGELYRSAIMAALKDGGYTVEEGSGPDKIIVGGITYDIIGSLNSPGATARAQFLKVDSSPQIPGGNTGGVPVGTPREIIFSTGNANTSLLTRINSASTLDERLGYVSQLRDIIVSALNASGHYAYTYGSHDKFVVDGTLVDFLRAAKGMGETASLQFLDMGPAINHGITGPEGKQGGGIGGNMVSAIFAAGASGMALLNQISVSSDLNERRQLATDFINIVVSALNASGLTASSHVDPDKIVANGITYDIIRRLNTPGAIAQLQVLKVT